MFCANCGKEVPAMAAECPACKIAVSPLASSSRPAVDIGAASGDAFLVIRTAFTDPVGGVPRAFGALTLRRALDAGIACGIMGGLVSMIGFYLTIPAWIRREPKTYLALLLLGASMFGGLALAGVAARKALGGTGRVEGDVFTAATALLPMSLLVLLIGILGLGNVEVIGLATLFVITWTVLMLFGGVARVSGVPEGRAAYAVPVMLAFSLWLTSVVFRAML